MYLFYFILPLLIVIELLIIFYFLRIAYIHGKVLHIKDSNLEFLRHGIINYELNEFCINFLKPNHVFVTNKGGDVNIIYSDKFLETKQIN